ncbi:MAG: hypothetical protein IJ518_01310 [Clostridia bacterium]|nr:hypothetical protein [Clostridia bacterium]
MAELSMTPEQMERLLVYASGRLGTTPEKLKAAFRQNGLAGLSAALTPEEAGRAEAVLGDREKAAALLQDPAVQRLLIQLLGNG